MFSVSNLQEGFSEGRNAGICWSSFSRPGIGTPLGTGLSFANLLCIFKTFFDLAAVLVYGTRLTGALVRSLTFSPDTLVIWKYCVRICINEVLFGTMSYTYTYTGNKPHAKIMKCPNKRLKYYLMIPINDYSFVITQLLRLYTKYFLFFASTYFRDFAGLHQIART